MAFCTLEEAWGQDYKSFLSPASLSPDWLQECRREKSGHSGSQTIPTGFSTEHERRFRYSGLDEEGTPYTEKNCGITSKLEHFKNSVGSPKRLKPVNEDEDFDLMLNHDEFNLPMHFESPEAIDPGLDDYYKLIDSELDKDTLNSYRYPYQDTNYAEELQFNHKCHAAFPEKAKSHLKKCKYCRKRLKQWLEELGELVSDVKNKAVDIGNDINEDIVQPTKKSIKQLFPDYLRGYIDLIFFIAVGVFLIFVLDTFVRLGKSFSKK